MRIFLTSVCISSVVSLSAFALGDLAHNYVAEQAAEAIPAQYAALQMTINTNRDVYLVGSDYPDTGYLPGFNFGEDSHWPYFVTPFAAYIKQTCANTTSVASSEHCDQLTAFLLGVSTHVKSDIVSHWTYYDLVAAHDFGSNTQDNWNKAHAAMDPASDFYVIVRKGIYDHPVIWWVPVNDLVNVYTTMKQNGVIKDTITAQEIIEANAIYYVALGLTEDLVAYPVYAYDAYYYIPWGIAHLDDTDPTEGAFPAMIAQSAVYEENVWDAIHGQSQLVTFSPSKAKTLSAQTVSQSATLVKQAITDGLLTVKPQQDAYGDVIFTPESIHFASENAKAVFDSRVSLLRKNLSKGE